MSKILENIIAKASALNKNIVLPEGEDKRVVVAAAQAVKAKLARITLLGDKAQIEKDNPDVDLEGVNIVTKHKKMRKQGEKSELKKMEGSIDISNVQIICGKCSKATRVGHKIEGDVKHRVCKKCGNVLDKKFVKAKAKDAEAQQETVKTEAVAKKPLQRREVKHVAESTIKKTATKKDETTAKQAGGK